jgi:hypothetical protein
MSAAKIDDGSAFSPVAGPHMDSRQVLHLSPENTLIRNNGIQFHYDTEIPAFTEMAVDLHDPADNAEIKANGIVVACSGDRHRGFEVSMLLLDLTEAHRARLGVLAYSHLA